MSSDSQVGSCAALDMRLLRRWRDTATQGTRESALIIELHEGIVSFPDTSYHVSFPDLERFTAAAAVIWQS